MNASLSQSEVMMINLASNIVNPNKSFIPISTPSIGVLEIEAVNDAVRSGWVSSLGPYLEKFEIEFAKFCQASYALTVSNGTTALHLALATNGIKGGDEVIVPNFTFVATANAVKFTGAEPILVDIDPLNYCISPDAIRKAITPRTKAIIPVHIYGHPCDMDAINEIARERNLIVIEDAAEAHGALYKGKPVGGLSTCGVFSFYGNKIITTGEGGMLVTNNKELYERAKLLRDHAMSKERKYWHLEVGFNYRMTNIQAALGLAQLSQINHFIKARNEILAAYQNYFKKSELINSNYASSWASPVCWLVCAQIPLLDDNKRQIVINKLKEKGIDTRPFFYPISDLPMYNGGATPVTKKIACSGINLPTYIGLEDSEIEFIVNKLIDTLTIVVH